MTLRIKDALQELTIMGGWRAFIMLPLESANAEGILEVLPWIEKGTPRPGTAMHLFEVKNGLALVTGGVLTEAEGARLFEVHDQLKGVATKMFVVPPAAAPAALIARMYDTGAVPLLPVVENLPSSRSWSILCVLAGLMAVITSVAAAAAQERYDHTTHLYFLLIVQVLLWSAVISGIKSWLQRRKLRDFLEDPVRMAITQWTPTLPPFVARR